jgi:hypothetical protein
MRILTLRRVNSDFNLAIHTLIMRYLSTVPDKFEAEETTVILENRLAIQLHLSQLKSTQIFGTRNTPLSDRLVLYSLRATIRI